MAAVVIGHAPLALPVTALAPAPDAAALPFLAASVALHLGYQIFLVAAYRIGDLTQVYPLARGAAPLIVALVSVGALGVVLSPSEILAIGAIGAGIMSLALVRRADGLRNPRAAGAALATGCFIAAYSLVDGWGARLSGSAIGYWAWAALGNAAVFGGWTMLVRRDLVRELARSRVLLRVGLIGGSASFVAYMLVIWAFTQAPIPLVTALRETSILFALAIGVTVLRERLDLTRAASAMMTLFGVVLLRFARSGGG
jgi:drug/metabolite transporter (DMT)-like permease